jgi:hypothetical protein
MAEAKEVEFTTRAGIPTVVEVVGEDGKKYEIRVQLAVMSVNDTHEMQPSPYGPIPKMQIQVQLAIETRPLGALPASTQGAR